MYGIIFSLMFVLEIVLSADIRDSRQLNYVERKESDTLTIPSQRLGLNNAPPNHDEHEQTTHRRHQQTTATIRKRKRRYDYEDVSDWDYDNENFDYEDESVSKWKKYSLNWEKVGLRMIYMGSTFIMITCCVCLCCRKCCSLLYDTCYYFVIRCVDKCLNRDPMYRQVKTFCDMAGFKMDHETYLDLKEGINEALAAQGINKKI